MISQNQENPRAEFELAEMATIHAARKLILRARALKQSLVIWKDGQVQTIDARKIPLPRLKKVKSSSPKGEA